MLLIFGLVALSDKFMGPKMAGFVPLPFADGQCLTYKASFAKEQNRPIENKVCFEKRNSGGFLEKEGPLETPYGENGLTNYAAQDIEKLKQVTGFKGINVFDKNIIKDMKNHSRFYSQANLQPGDVFYNKYTVREFADFNGKATFVVETAPWIDTTMTTKGPVGKAFWGFIKKYDKRIYKPTVRTGSSTDVVERYYYDKNTGILEGMERFRVIRDIEGSIIGEDNSDYQGKYTSILIGK